MENIITSIIGLIASVVMLVFSIWYIKVNIEINKARQKRIDDLKVYLDEFKTNTKIEFNKFIDSAKEAENLLQIRDMPMNIKTPECKYKFKTIEEMQNKPKQPNNRSGLNVRY